MLLPWTGEIVYSSKQSCLEHIVLVEVVDAALVAVVTLSKRPVRLFSLLY